MRAIRVATLTGPDDVELAEVDRPTPGHGEVLVEVAYAGVTFPELLQTRGMYQVKHDLPFVLGSEAAGIVAEAGPGSRFSVGDRVAAIPGKGSFAEFMVVSDEQTVPVPDGISLAHAAGMPMNVLTADFALRLRAQAKAGQSILVHGAAGGLGSAAVQMALAIGLEVIGVVSTEAKAQTVRELGATHVVMAEGFKDATKEICPNGVDYVFDPVGGDRFTDSTRVLAPYGRLLVLGFTAGEIPSVKVNRLLLKNISVDGVAWGAATRERPGYIAEQWDAIADYVAAGKLNPAIHGTYPLSDAATAIGELDSRSVQGKVLLEVKGE
ncbi:NADPH:quinone oxidoreductase family protein [Brevibacterium sp. UCMA 11752]|uniref:NADPH:quinone oxidoreductase family protein n=1 Tax=Brevibacterium sp. UCMA 11752 TaxID=2745946 RepID=UPI001F15F2B7|nr:NADPH:quinone oxidoreductase family protein [Brevibacterium sp. UCMA 11752]MCF2588732.1 NADPH:quinone oxidoreductase family protein [Brevibacterium sp. UCMA 11752]